MCGFVIHKVNTPDQELTTKVIQNMGYRGLPGYDNYKHWKGYDMAHTALPMVNKDREKSIQPISNHAWDTPSMFVGEIFNWQDFGEFDHDGHMLHSLYKEMNDDEIFHHFDGFWSYITFVEGKAIVYTDFLGIKPVYYRTDMEAIASEPNALLAFGKVTPNMLHLSNVMKWGYDPTGATPWNEIRQLSPGHYLYDGQEVRYWDWEKVPLTSLREDLTTAVINRLGGFREASILLSGGLDSTIIYELIKEQGLDITPIHVNNHEKDFASLICKDLVEVSLESISDREAIAIHQTPVDLGSVKPQIAMGYKLQELGFHNVLTGDGADELFGGYRRAKDYDSQLSDTFYELPYYHLPKLDRTMMYSTVELRAPFLSPAVICHGINTPYTERNGEKKKLKEIFSDLVPNKILERDKHPLKTDAIRQDPMKQRQINHAIWRDQYGF